MFGGTAEHPTPSVHLSTPSGNFQGTVSDMLGKIKCDVHTSARANHSLRICTVRGNFAVVMYNSNCIFLIDPAY